MLLIKDHSAGAVFFLVDDGGCAVVARSYFDLKLLRQRWRCTTVPVDRPHKNLLLPEIRLLADHHGVAGRLQAEHIVGGGVGQPQAAALAHGIVHDAGMLADLGAFQGLNGAGGRRAARAGQEPRHGLAFKETDILTFRAVQLVQAEFGGQGPHPGLMQLTQGEEEFGQLGLGELVEEVGLILFRVHALEQPGMAVGRLGQPGIVAGGQPITGLQYPVKQQAEFDVPIAAHARVGGAARRKGLSEVGHHVLGKRGLQVDDLKRYVQGGRHPLDLAHLRFQVGLGQGHEHPPDPGPLLPQQGGGDAGIHPAAHGHGNLYVFQGIHYLGVSSIPHPGLTGRLRYPLLVEKTMTKTIAPAIPGRRFLPELLAPAGSFEKLKIAVFYGADAVYLGGSRFSLRARAANFSEAGIRQAVAYAHEHRVRVYCTVNIFAHEAHFAGLDDYLRFLAEAGVDGLIVADPGILMRARELAPGLPLHLSTQANVTNAASARFWASQGVRRLNLARELSLAELSAIRGGTEAEIEVFVHGALCISYSGRCLLSTYLTGRHANQGDCAQPCRYRYRLMEEKRPGQYFPVEEDGRGTYIFNAKDLCLLRRLPELRAAGVDCLKIEGRMKSIAYVGQTVRLYRAALDLLAAQPLPMPSDWWPPALARELALLGSRGFTENFLDGRPGPADMLYDATHQGALAVPVGVVRQGGAAPRVEARNPILLGDRLTYLGPGLRDYELTVLGMRRVETGEELARANPNDLVLLTMDGGPPCWEEHALLRKGVPMDGVSQPVKLSSP